MSDFESKKQDILDRFAREIAVDGLHNHGYNTKSQGRLPTLSKALDQLYLDELEKHTRFYTEPALEEAVPIEAIKELLS